jgi:cytochrome c oxidase subunit II
LGSFLYSLYALLQAQVPELPEHRVGNIFKPLASPARWENDIGLLTIAITTGIFVVVASIIVYTILRFRRKPSEDMHQEPAQVFGSNQIELAWTVIPVLIVFVLIGVTARVVASVQNASPPKSTLKITVVGHQWWWEVRYPDYHIVTANEVHMPSSPDGKAASYLELTSVDVAHSFWIPQLSGKMDAIPNRINYLWMDPRERGTYWGNCAEYCGTQHANMLLRVIAQPEADFKAWAAEQQKPAAESDSGANGKALFQSLSCVNCHVVRGTPAEGKFGPDLTHLMSRQTIGSGVLDNSPQNLRAWVNDPQQSKPGCLMPSLKLTEGELKDVVTYLESLK